MAGRPPKPSALKLIEGNKGKRAPNKQEPDPAYLNDLSAPEWMPDGARKVWDEIVPHLRLARMLSTVDVPMLAMGCCSIDEYRQASKLADKRHGLQASHGRLPAVRHVAGRAHAHRNTTAGRLVRRQ